MALYRCMMKNGGGQCASGSFTHTDTVNHKKVTLGFKPKALSVFNGANNTKVQVSYNSDFSTTQALIHTSSGAFYNLGDDYVNRLYSIDNDGFTMCKINSNGSGTWYYVAVG